MLLKFPPRHVRASAGSAGRACASASNSKLIAFPSVTLCLESESQCSDGIDPRDRQELTVDALTPNRTATAPVPPSSSMIPSTVMDTLIVRKSRTGQEFAESEKLSGFAYGEIPPMADTVKVIAARLVTTREALGFSQSEFCEKIKVAKNVYNPFERGARRMSLNVAVKIRDRFGISLDWLYCGDSSRLPAELYRKISRAA